MSYFDRLPLYITPEEKYVFDKFHYDISNTSVYSNLINIKSLFIWVSQEVSQESEEEKEEEEQEEEQEEKQEEEESNNNISYNECVDENVCENTEEELMFQMDLDWDIEKGRI